MEKIPAVRMFSKTWETSERKYNVVVERSVRIPMSDGVSLNADIFRPDSDERFPAILGIQPFSLRNQSAPIKPKATSGYPYLHPGEEKKRGNLEAGDYNFYVRRGYVHVIASRRGTGKSEGLMGDRPSARDTYEVIEWIAKQPWCTGKVGMFGVSAFAIAQLMVAALNPPSLKCLFAPFAQSDHYRNYYDGGLLGAYVKRLNTMKGYDNPRGKKIVRDEKFNEAVAKLLEDEDIAAVPELVDVLKNPDEGINSLYIGGLLNPFDGPYWERVNPNFEAIKIPAYIGACWATYGGQLPGAFRNWEKLKVPKKMVIGPPLYLDRPLYQYQYESLRWFDYWLKGMDTGIMEEAPIRLFVMGTNQWKETSDWPLPETKWTPFYLHEDGLLFEHEHWPNEGFDSYEDGPWGRGYLEYLTPPLVDDIEVIGPITLNLYASTTDNEVFWYISLREVNQQGEEKILTRGRMRGSHREVDLKRSKPWELYHPHTKREPLTPGGIYEFNIRIVPTGNMFRAGSRIKIKISSAIDEPLKNRWEAGAAGLKRQSPSRITVYHDANYPSHLLLPITSGNVIGTYISGGKGPYGPSELR